MPRRADALDALRGFAILTMALSGMLHAYDLPDWMYHAQLVRNPSPPPTRIYDLTVPGLTWVDLVFPFFLFSMGAAMPLALSRRIAAGARWWKLAAYALRRGVLLLAFAVYVDHVVPWKFQVDGRVSPARWLWALLAFAVLFPALARLPAAWGAGRRWLARVVGWGGAAAVLATVHYPDGSGFSIRRADIIIVILAHTVVAGSLIWLLSRNSPVLRMGFILGVLACVLGAEADGWLRQIWHHSPIRSLLLLGFLKYLLIVLPGTIAGDLLLAWLGGSRDGDAGNLAGRAKWSAFRHFGIAAFMVGLCVLVCAGLQARWLPWTTLAAFAACASGTVLFSSPAACHCSSDTALERGHHVLLRRLYGWGVLWLVVGLLLEPYEGGIRKDHATLSYYFVTSGLAIFALIFFSVAIDALGRRWWLSVLIDNGKNPMIAYVGIRNLVPPVLGLLGVERLLAPLLRPSVWLGFVWASVKTSALALAVSAFTRRRIYWRT